MRTLQQSKRDALKVIVKRIMLKTPDISLADLMEELDYHGLSARKPTVRTIREEFRHSLKFLQAEGYLKADLSKIRSDRA